MNSEAEPRLIARFQSTSKLCALLASAAGLLGLAGWMLDIQALKSILPGLVTMKANTALGLLLAGLSLWVLQAIPENHRRFRLRRRLARVGAALVVLLGALTLAQFLFGWNLGIDQLFFEEPPGAVATSDPGRMAPASALSLLLVAVSLLFLDHQTRRGRVPAQALALVAGTLSALALVGYAFGVAALYGLAPYTAMALHTAVAFAFLSLGLLCARPGRGLMALFTSPGAGGVLLRRLILPILTVPLLLAWLRWLGERAKLYDTPFGVSLMVVTTILALILLVWWVAESLERSEAERRQVQQELDSIFSLSLDLLCIAGFDGYFKRLNPAWEKTLGYSQLELLSRPYLDFVHPDDREPTFAESAKIGEGATTLSFENRYRARDGSYRWLLWTATPVTQQGLIYAAARDITDRKRAEELLRQSEERHRVMFERSPQPMWVFDRETLAFLAVNDAAIRHYGYSREEFLHMTIADIRPEQDVPLLRKHLETAGSQEGNAGTWLHCTKDGRRLEVEVFAQPFTHAGRPASLVVAYDITERKRAEQSLLELNRELEAFTYSVSHDLRAPLRHIDGFSQMLSEDFGPQLPEGAQRYLARIRAGTRQMGQLVDDLLNLARVGRQELRLQVTGLNSLVEEVRGELLAEAEGRQVEWEVGSLPFVECDPALMKQVFANLLSNALKYSRPRSPAIVEIGQAEQNGQPVIFVRDNGVGFSMKYAHKLFGVFQRLHRPEDFEGTGVGLATVERILRKHGGRVWAEAELDKGATFFFTLGSELAAPPSNPILTGART